MKWTREYRRQVRAQRVADGRCVDCDGLMLPEWPKRVYCPTCADVRQAVSRRYRHSAKGRKRLRARIRNKRKDPAFRAKEAAKTRARQLQKKIDGECHSCRAPCLDDSVFCAKHHAYNLAQRRSLYRRQAARRRGETVPDLPRTRVTRRKAGRSRRAKVVDPVIEIVSSSPIDDYRSGETTLASAAVRYASLCNGVTVRDIGEAFGGDRHERNAIQQAIGRAIRLGRLRVDGTDGWTGERLVFPVRPARERRAA